MKTTFASLFAILFTLPLFSAPFQNGETVCFYGDSITHGGLYGKMISDYYLMHYPDRTVRFVNAGISGDSAGGAQGRMKEDVCDYKPTAVTVMFGMNDIGRGNYVLQPTEKQQQGQERSMTWYQKNMDKVISRLQKEAGNPVLYYITPSPFDDEVKIPNQKKDNNNPGCNAALGRCAAFVRDAAAKDPRGTLVDFYTTMNAFNRGRQKTDPTYTIIGPDRIHPRAPGHLFMTWVFLKAQGVSPLVSDVRIDASTGKIEKSEQATVSDLQADDKGVTFRMSAKRLPFAIDPSARYLLPLISIEKDLNQEVLAVRQLPEGTYRLTIDGKEVGSYSAKELSAGLWLGFNEKTPQYQQSLALFRANETRRRTECRLRDFAAVRWFLRRFVNPDDLEAVKVFAETKMNPKGWYESKVPNYLKKWNTREAIRAEIQQQEKNLAEMAKPKTRMYRLERQ